ncbi:Shedu anti-phage system protein SduA domain-containing protein [Streptomyces sp. YGL11-2]|uniref:Shedu anti-phage system protein SduA domain-containing protein n=1 Tax=Streptomyces sp. YGL11-2 TaxID=3414028 RepID=UPI003CED6C9B
MKYWLKVAEDKAAAYNVSRNLEAWSSCLSAVVGPDAEVGDAVLLWRVGRGGGVVAIGEIVSAKNEPASGLRALWMQEEEKTGEEVPAPSQLRAVFGFRKLLLSTPLSSGVLRAAGLTQVVKGVRLAGWDRKPVVLDLNAAQWRELVQLADEVQPSEDLPAAWNIPPGAVVKRAELHDVYGGNPRVTTGSSGRTPNAFVFLDGNGLGDELGSCWDGAILLAPGQSQWERSVSSENMAVLAHLRRGVPVRAFARRGADCLYLGEFAIDLERPVERWVMTGQRNMGRTRAQQFMRETTTPVLRLRQLAGVSIPTNTTDAFRDAPHVSLRLQPASNQPAATAVRELLTILESEPAIAASLGGLDEAQVLAALVQRARRQTDLDELRTAVEDDKTSEAELQKLVERMTWIFGGEFLSGTARRNLTVRDQLDLSLVRPDGTLHGVELKRANIGRLVTGQRNHLIVGPKVNEAVGQAMNYLRELDEKRPQILIDHGIDCRRASMTVVIGHSGFVTTGATPAEVDETIRTYNSHWNRLNVITYDRLIENAQRTLDLTAPER